jgi:hypothetical protein
MSGMRRPALLPILLQVSQGWEPGRRTSRDVCTRRKIDRHVLIINYGLDT